MRLALTDALDMKTPCEKFKSLRDAGQNLKLGITIEELDVFATQYSDSEAAIIYGPHTRTNSYHTTNSSLKEKREIEEG